MVAYVVVRCGCVCVVGEGVGPNHRGLLFHGILGALLVHTALPGWSEKTSSARTYDELPANAKAYIRRIEHLMQIPVTWVGIGASRASMLPTW
jgi:adenylosuccinate synthase